jgi:hypothetical protein
MSVALRTATAEDARHAAEVLLSSRKAFLPYAPSVHTDAEVHRWVREVLIPSGGVTVACAGTLVVGVLARRASPASVGSTNSISRQAMSGKVSVHACLATRSRRCPCRCGSTRSRPTHAPARSTSATASRPWRSATVVRMRSTVPMFCTNLPLRQRLGHNRSCRTLCRQNLSQERCGPREER